MAIPADHAGAAGAGRDAAGLWKTALAVGFVYIPLIARVARSVTLGLAGEDFVQAARARAEGPGYILFREILPNAWPPLIVEASLRVTYAILLGSALSFLGLGAQPPSSDWGLMIAEARQFIDRAPWIALAPGFAMCLLVDRHQPDRRRPARAARSAPASARWRRPDAMTLTIEGLTVRYRTPGGDVTALTDVSLARCPAARRSRVVGESGSGKSTIALAVMGLLPAEAQVAAGRILFEGSDVLALIAESAPQAARRAAWRWCSRIRSPCSTRRCGSARRSAKALVYHRGLTREAALARAVELLRRGRHRRAARRGRAPIRMSCPAACASAR